MRTIFNSFKRNQIHKFAQLLLMDGLKIGVKIHLMDIDENTPIFSQFFFINITFPYMYEIFIL